MFFDAEQTMIAVEETERYRPPVQSGTGKSLLLGVIIGVVLGRKSK